MLPLRSRYKEKIDVLDRIDILFLIYDLEVRIGTMNLPSAGSFRWTYSRVYPAYHDNNHSNICCPTGMVSIDEPLE
jgi:hypothetical protein